MEVDHVDTTNQQGQLDGHRDHREQRRLTSNATVVGLGFGQSDASCTRRPYVVPTASVCQPTEQAACANALLAMALALEPEIKVLLPLYTQPVTHSVVHHIQTRGPRVHANPRRLHPANRPVGPQRIFRSYRVGDIVHTLKQSGHQVALARTLDSLCVGVCCLSEIRLHVTSIVTELTTPSLSSRFRLRASGDAEAAAAGYAGVDIALSDRVGASLLNRIPFGSWRRRRLCAVRLATSVKESHKRQVDRCLFIVSAYAPTDCSSDIVKDRFYDALSALLRRAKSSDIVVVAGDMNAQVGRLSASETQLGGRHELDSVRTDTGERLLQLCADRRLFYAVLTSGIAEVVWPVGVLQQQAGHKLKSTTLPSVTDSLLSLLTLQRLDHRFTVQKNLDLRRLLVGDSRLISSIVEFVEDSFAAFLQSVSYLPLTPVARDACSQIISQSVKSRVVVFGLLLHRNHLVSLVRMKGHELHPADIHLIINLLRANYSGIDDDLNFPPTPVSSHSGFLYANIAFLDNHTSSVLLSVDSTQFYALEEAKDAIFDRLKSTNGGEYVTAITTTQFPSVRDIGVPELRHLVCKYLPTAQYVATEWTVPYLDPQSDGASCSVSGDSQISETSALRAKILQAYRRMYCRLHNRRYNIRLIYQSTPTEVFFAWLGKSLATIAASFLFVYLGGYIGAGDLGKDNTSTRIGKTGSAFLNLRHLWRRRDISFSFKGGVCNAAVRSILLCGSESWPLRAEDVKRLSMFDHRCLRSIARILWEHRISNAEVRRMIFGGTNSPTIDELITLYGCAGLDTCYYRSTPNPSTPEGKSPEETPFYRIPRRTFDPLEPPKEEAASSNQKMES
ncbi:hypothetical protein T265_05427 [Opisthorchis viverrini]|uniref:Vacuolar fusion protein MON1 homolog n=1 Tax=Opisthorchis viverrini TaxID=6198 RepID=A0A074ZP07_OPIVI|nr:hypothetical protein T265_05427 [Opisthorchis viverrini]KER27537.1 hypothetical protein T265_05427 [Opisthorchis viverrini]